MSKKIKFKIKDSVLFKGEGEEELIGVIVSIDKKKKEADVQVGSSKDDVWTVPLKDMKFNKDKPEADEDELVDGNDAEDEDDEDKDDEEFADDESAPPTDALDESGDGSNEIPTDNKKKDPQLYGYFPKIKNSSRKVKYKGKDFMVIFDAEGKVLVPASLMPVLKKLEAKIDGGK